MQIQRREDQMRDDWSEQAGRLARLVLRQPFRRQTWAELGFFLASSVLAFVGVFALAALGMAGVLLTVVSSAS